MRCSGPPCHLGPYCWRDNIGNKHYKLKTHHLRNLIKYVEQGYTLRAHDDVPDEIREQLYAKEAHYIERQRKQGASQAGFPPINITNVMPAQSPQGFTPCSVPATPESTGSLPCDHSVQLEIAGLRDMAVKRYSDRQCSQVGDEALKMEYRKACDLNLSDGLDLEQVYKDQDAGFYIELARDLTWGLPPKDSSALRNLCVVWQERQESWQGRDIPTFLRDHQEGGRRQLAQEMKRWKDLLVRLRQRYLVEHRGSARMVFGEGVGIDGQNLGREVEDGEGGFVSTVSHFTA